MVLELTRPLASHFVQDKPRPRQARPGPAANLIANPIVGCVARPLTENRDQRGGLVLVPGRAQLRCEAAAQLVEPLPGPLHDMERIKADRRLRRFLADDIVDPLRAVRVAQFAGRFDIVLRT